MNIEALLIRPEALEKKVEALEKENAFLRKRLAKYENLRNRQKSSITIQGRTSSTELGTIPSVIGTRIKNGFYVLTALVLTLNLQNTDVLITTKNLRHDDEDFFL